jgi:hypothetical protein
MSGESWLAGLGFDDGDGGGGVEIWRWAGN